MTNHIHFVVVPGNAAGLSKAMGRAAHDYARWLNTRCGHSGHLWQDRFFSCPMDEAHTWAALAYVERNPVRAGLVERAEDWRWSSARTHLGVSNGTPWFDLGKWSQQWTPDLWRTAVEDGLAEAGIRQRMAEAMLAGRPLGSELFIDACEQQFGSRLRKRKPGPPARKSSGDMVTVTDL